jgi:hypothetical protein
MSQLKCLVPLLALIATLLWPLPAMAADPTPDTCLAEDGQCYASNSILDGTRTGYDADGTAMAPWLATTDQAMLNLRNAVSGALADDGYDGAFFAAIICSGGSCQTTWYEYDEDGEEVRSWTDPGIPPEVGVGLPLPYVLGGGALLGVLLLSIGVALRRRARRMSV